MHILGSVSSSLLLVKRLNETEISIFTCDVFVVSECNLLDFYLPSMFSFFFWYCVIYFSTRYTSILDFTLGIPRLIQVIPRRSCVSVCISAVCSARHVLHVYLDNKETVDAKRMKKIWTQKCSFVLHEVCLYALLRFGRPRNFADILDTVYCYFF